MKKWMIGVACLLAFAFGAPGAFVAPPAQAVTATTKYTLTTNAWTDLGVGPVLVSAAGRVAFAVADTTPSLVSEGFSVLPGASFTFNTSSHVWAMSLDGISPFVYASPILASGGSGGSLVGGTTPVTGTCPAGQFLYNNSGVLGCSASSATIALPQAVTGGVSGGIPYFSATTTMAASALMPTGSVVTGGGAGAAPVGLADVAAGSYLKSGGVTTIPAWQAFGTNVQAAVAINLNASGGLASAAAPLTAGGTGSLSGAFGYYICTGVCTITLPAPAAGFQFCVRNGNGVTTVITIAAISTVQFEKTTYATYGTAGTGTMVSGGAAGDKICLIGLDATHYLVGSFVGTWTNS